MGRERYATSYSYASNKPLIARAWMVLLVITGITLLVLARSQHPAATALRARMLDLTGPVLSVLSQPVSGIKSLVAHKNNLFNAMAENERLKTENDTLRHWQAVAQSLKAENDALRRLSGYQPVEQVSYVTGRVIGQSPSAYAGTLTINAGRGEGIGMLQPVVDAHGLVGRITEVGESNARVLLLADPSSRIPVISATSRQHAILAGTGDALLELTFINGDAENIELGETIVTTEEGGLIPGGIIVGTVFRRDANGLMVKPLRPLAEAEYLRVIVSK